MTLYVGQRVQGKGKQDQVNITGMIGVVVGKSPLNTYLVEFDLHHEYFHNGRGLYEGLQTKNKHGYYVAPDKLVPLPYEITQKDVEKIL